MKKQKKSTLNQYNRTSAFDVVLLIVLGLMALVTLYPFYYVLIVSVSNTVTYATHPLYLLPYTFDWTGYQTIFNDPAFYRSLGVTLFVTFVGTALNMLLSVTGAYALSRKTLIGRNFFLELILFTMLFSGGMIPNYLLMKQLGIINTRWAMLLPGALSVYNMILTRTYILSSVPVELLEASQIDGCSDARYFFSILLPLSQAVISVISLYYAVAHWNSYFSALIYIRDKQLQPLQLILRSILLSTRVSLNEFEDPDLLEGKIGLEFLVKFALIVVSSAPIMCLYPFVQKFFAKGVMLGSVKG